MECTRCGKEIPPDSKRIKYCSSRCSTLYLKALYRERHKQKILEYAKDYRDKNKEKIAERKKTYRKSLGHTCKVCGKRILSTYKGKKYCSEFCAKKYYKKVYYKRHKEKVLKYKREYEKRKAIGRLQKVFDTGVCYFCGTSEELVFHHLEYKPEQKLVRMCASCHRKLHKLLRYRNSSVAI